LSCHRRPHFHQDKRRSADYHDSPSRPCLQVTRATNRFIAQDGLGRVSATSREFDCRVKKRIDSKQDTGSVINGFRDWDCIGTSSFNPIFYSSAEADHLAASILFRPSSPLPEDISTCFIGSPALTLLLLHRVTPIILLGQVTPREAVVRLRNLIRQWDGAFFPDSVVNASPSVWHSGCSFELPRTRNPNAHRIDTSNVVDRSIYSLPLSSTAPPQPYGSEAQLPFICVVEQPSCAPSTDRPSQIPAVGCVHVDESTTARFPQHDPLPNHKLVSVLGVLELRIMQAHHCLPAQHVTISGMKVWILRISRGDTRSSSDIGESPEAKMYLFVTAQSL